MLAATFLGIYKTTSDSNLSMRQTFHLAFIATLLFLSTQFVSMFAGMTVIASLADLDNIDDLSLEDIIVLDPFLGTSSEASSDSFSKALSLTRAKVVALLVLIARPPDAEAIALAEGQLARSSENSATDLWLSNRVLLI